MKRKTLRKGINNTLAILLAALPLTTTITSAVAQTPVKAAKSCATPQQDLELGRQAAAEAEKQFQLLNDQRVQEYIRRVGENLARNTPNDANFPFTFKVLNVAEINAFALPGGPTYINRGTIEAAKNEAELAGVMAHELSHVVLRHGTANVCRAQNLQGIAGVIGAVLGNGVLGTIGGVAAQIGAGSVLMKNSRAAETDADVLGSQIMARAGYDPTAMADFFETLAGEQSREPGKLERWFSDHPQPTDRRDRIKKESQLIGARGSSREVGGFADVKRTLMGMPKAPSTQQQQPQQGGQQPTNSGQPVNVRVEAPSSTLRIYRHQTGTFEIAQPNNWQASTGNVGLNTTLYPNGGITQEGIVYGVMVDSYQSQGQQNIDPRTRRPRPASLETATKEIVDNLLRGNNYLRVVSGPGSGGKISGRDALTVTMEGRSPITNRDERAVLFNMQLNNGDSLFVVFVTPKDEFSGYQNLFRRMLQSLRING